jgi:hypothetical protein
MKGFGLIAWMFLFTACTVHVHVIKEDEDAPFKESVEALRQQEGSFALVLIAGEVYPCQIMKVNAEWLTLQNRETVSEIPLKAVSSITIRHGKADHPSLLAGAAVGALTGAIVGTAISRSTTNYASGSRQHQLQAASGLAGVLAGMVAVQGWGSNGGENLELNSEVKSCRIADRESITGMEAMQACVFGDLKLSVGEQLLKVRAYQYSKDRYLIVYEVHDGKDNTIHWETVESAYIQQQEMKLKATAASGGKGLHLFKEQEK